MARWTTTGIILKKEDFINENVRYLGRHRPIRGAASMLGTASARGVSFTKNSKDDSEGITTRK